MKLRQSEDIRYIKVPHTPATPPVEPALSKAFNVLHLLLSGMPINIAGAHARPRVNQILREGFGGRRLRKNIVIVDGQVPWLLCTSSFGTVSLYIIYQLFTHIWLPGKINVALYNHCTKSQKVLFGWKLGCPLSHP
jgi:hypothetical protein